MEALESIDLGYGSFVPTNALTLKELPKLKSVVSRYGKKEMEAPLGRRARQLRQVHVHGLAGAGSGAAERHVAAERQRVRVCLASDAEQCGDYGRRRRRLLACDLQRCVIAWRVRCRPAQPAQREVGWLVGGNAEPAELPEWVSGGRMRRRHDTGRAGVGGARGREDEGAGAGG